MEIQKLKIFNPNDKPFGPLSNMFPMEDFKINNVKYRNLNNYIYSFLGCDSFSRNRLANMSNQGEVYTTAMEINNKCYLNTTLEAYQKAYDVYFNKEDEMIKLISTGNKNILFDVPDKVLGYANGEGENLIGKMLEDIRKSKYYKFKEDKEKELEQIKKFIFYKYFMVVFYLEKLINSKRFIDDPETSSKNLDEYINLNIDEIVDKIGFNNLAGQYMSFETFDKNNMISGLENSEKFRFFIKHSKDIANYIRKQYLKMVKQNILEDEMYKIDLLYIYLLKKNLLISSVISQKEALKLIRKYYDTQNFSKLADKLMDDFKNGTLDPEIAQEFIQKLNIPSEEEIKAVEDQKFEENPDQKLLYFSNVNIDDFIKTLLKDENPDENQVRFYDKGFLSPYQYTRMLKIDDNFFPTVYHYVLVRLVIIADIWSIEKLDISTDEYKNFINRAHTFIMQNIGLNPFLVENYNFNFRDLDDQLDKILKDYFSMNVYKRLEISLIQKFRNLRLRQLLVNTGDDDIIYTDYKDEILGGRLNELGKSLMRLRDRYMAEGMMKADIEFKDIKLIEIVDGNKKFENWVNKRLNDIITSIRSSMFYLGSLESNIKFNTNLLSPELTEYIIVNLYRACEELLLKTTNISDIPVEIYRKCYNSLKEYGIGPRSIVMIWIYLSSLINGVKSFITPQNKKYKNLNEVMDAIYLIPLMEMKEMNCNNPLPKTENNSRFKNCVIFAINYIIKCMRGFINNYSKMKLPAITKTDLLYAFRIIYPSVNLTEIPIVDEYSGMDLQLNVSNKEFFIEFFPFLEGYTIEEQNKFIVLINWFMNYLILETKKGLEIKKTIIARVMMFRNYSLQMDNLYVPKFQTLDKVIDENKVINITEFIRKSDIAEDKDITITEYELLKSEEEKLKEEEEELWRPYEPEWVYDDGEGVEDVGFEREVIREKRNDEYDELIQLIDTSEEIDEDDILKELRETTKKENEKQFITSMISVNDENLIIPILNHLISLNRIDLINRILNDNKIAERLFIKNSIIKDFGTFRKNMRIILSLNNNDEYTGNRYVNIQDTVNDIITKIDKLTPDKDKKLDYLGMVITKN